MSSSDKKYKLDEVAKHNTKNDCWLTIHHKVYNVTPFLDDHPGGDDVLMTSTGKDASDDFEDVGHSDNAREQLKDYYVGDLDTSSLLEKKDSGSKRQMSAPKTAQTGQSSGFLVKLLQFLVPVVILALAYALKKYKE